MVLKIDLAKEIARIFNMKYFQNGVTDRRHFLCGDLVPWLEPFEKVLAIDGFQDTFVCVPLTILWMGNWLYSQWIGWDKKYPINPPVDIVLLVRPVVNHLAQL